MMIALNQRQENTADEQRIAELHRRLRESGESIERLASENSRLESRVAELEDDKQTLLRAVNGDPLELQCLKDQGVDNWGGYADAMEALWELQKTDKRGEGES